MLNKAGLGPRFAGLGLRSLRTGPWSRDPRPPGSCELRAVSCELGAGGWEVLYGNANQIESVLRVRKD